MKYCFFFGLYFCYALALSQGANSNSLIVMDSSRLSNYGTIQQAKTITNNYFYSKKKLPFTLRGCLEAVSKEFGLSKDQAAFKILLLPFYPQGKQERTLDWCHIIKGRLESLCEEEGIKVNCQILNCGDSIVAFYREDVERIKKSTSANLILYGSYDRSVDADTASLRLNWIGDSVKIICRLHYDSVIYTNQSGLQNNKVRYDKISTLNVISGKLESSINFIVNFLAGLSMGDNYYGYPYFRKALSEASTHSDSLISIKKLIFLMPADNRDSSRLNYLDLLLREEPNNQLYMFIKTSDNLRFGDFAEAKKQLSIIEILGLDTTVIPQDLFTTFSVTAELAQGNLSAYVKHVGPNSRNLYLNEVLIGYYMAANNADSIIKYCTKTIDICTMESRLYFDTVRQTDSITFSYSVCGDSIIKSGECNIMNNTWTLYTKNIIKIKPFAYKTIFLRAYYLKRKELFLNALNDLSLLHSQDPTYLDHQLSNGEDIYSLRSSIYFKLFSFGENVNNLSNSFKDLQTSIQMFRTYHFDNNNIWTRYCLARRYTLMAGLFFVTQKADSVNYYMDKALILLNDSVGLFQRAAFLMEDNIPSSLLLSIRGYSEFLAKSKLHDKTYLTTCFYQYSSALFSLGYYEDAKDQISCAFRNCENGTSNCIDVDLKNQMKTLSLKIEAAIKNNKSEPPFYDD